MVFHLIFSTVRSLGGGGVSDQKLEKANMTQEDWIRLTNRPDVVEKDMIKLLDWFIKVISIRINRTEVLNAMLFRPIHQEEYHNYFSKSFSQPLQQEKH